MKFELTQSKGFSCPECRTRYVRVQATDEDCTECPRRIDCLTQDEKCSWWRSVPKYDLWRMWGCETYVPRGPTRLENARERREE